MSIAPIIPGQKASAPTTSQEVANSAPSTSQTASAPHETSNLIDFGGSSTNHATEPTQKSRDQAAVAQQHSEKKKSALDDMSSLREPLQPVIHRQDSVEGVEDEFVDAES